MKLLSRAILCLASFILIGFSVIFLIKEIKVRGSFSGKNQRELGKAIIEEDLVYISKHKNLINQIGKKNVTPLMFALKNKKPQSFKCLIENGANINLVVENESVIRTASTYIDLFYLETCLKNGGDVNLLHSQGNRPLSFALEAENYEGVKFLLKNGADANLSDEYNNTCFVSLFVLHECDKILFLLNNGVNPMQSSDLIKSDIIYSVETIYMARDMTDKRYKNLPIVIEKLESLGFKFKLQELDEKLKEEELKGNYKPR